MRYEISVEMQNRLLKHSLQFFFLFEIFERNKRKKEIFNVRNLLKIFSFCSKT